MARVATLGERGDGVGGERLTETLAGHAAGLRYEALPEPVRRTARHCLLDWLGVTVAGADDATSRVVLAEALEQGGAAQASIVGQPRRTSMMQAALVNGTCSHALDYDDVNHAMLGHPSVPVAPVVLALAEHHGHSGRDVIAAFVAGVETECRVGRLVTPAHYERGFHATGTLGTLAAAAAASNLMRLDARTTATALGIAATQAAGLKSMFGTMCKPLHAGKAAANGLYAASLARRGFTSRTDVLECAQGLVDTHGAVADAGAALAGLGTEWLIQGTLFKYHAACYGTHASIEAARALVAAHRFSSADIAAVEIRVPLGNLRMCNIQAPATGLEAKFSLTMTTAMALAGHDTAAIETYCEKTCAEPDLNALISRATVIGDAGCDDFTSEVTVRLGDGAVHRQRGDVSRPESDLDAREDKLTRKFLTLATPRLGVARGTTVAQSILDLDAMADLGALMADMRG